MQYTAGVVWDLETARSHTLVSPSTPNHRILLIAWPFLLAAGMFLAGAAYIYGALGQLGDHGPTLYGLDDAYIHLAMARNLVDHGVWGVTPYEFSATSSSPLWVLLLSIPRVLGLDGSSSPLCLNLLAGLGTLGLVAWLLRRHAAPAPLSALTFLLVIIQAQILPLVFTGMEHVLHTLATLAAMALAISVSRRPGSRRRFLALLIVTTATTGLRYEGLFLLPAICSMLALRGQTRRAVLVGVAGLAPVVVMGWIQTANGAFFLPNSLLLKSTVPRLTLFALARQAWEGLSGHRELGRLVMLCLVMGGSTFWFSRQWTRAHDLAAAFLTTVTLHAAASRLGIAARYEFYLVVVGLTALALLAAEAWRAVAGRPGTLVRSGQIAAALLVLGLMGEGIDRHAARSLEFPPRAMRNIHDQHVQMGRFLARNYDGRAIAANDIGAVTYLADVRLLDLVGLGSNQVTRLKKNGEWGRSSLTTIARDHGVEIAVIYREWYVDVLPEDWIEVATWTVEDNAVSHATVTFLATSPPRAAELTRNLRAFTPELPDGVVVDIPQL